MIVTIIISELNIFFIVISIGTLVFISQRTAPITIKTNNMLINDMMIISNYIKIKGKGLIGSMFYIIWMKSFIIHRFAWVKFEVLKKKITVCH
jgi:hypothetical protein